MVMTSKLAIKDLLVAILLFILLFFGDPKLAVCVAGIVFP